MGGCWCSNTFSETTRPIQAKLMWIFHEIVLFICVEVLRPCQHNGVMSSAVSLPNHTFTGQA